jgi:hypothetical protein
MHAPETRFRISKKSMMVVIAFGILVAVVVLLGIILVLATPVPWPISAGELKARKVNIAGQEFVMIDGEGMNYLGQMQLINVEVNDKRRRIVVERSLIRRNPFTEVSVNNQWPVFYPLDSLKPGEYNVVYNTGKGEATAGLIQAP